MKFRVDFNHYNRNAHTYLNELRCDLEVYNEKDYYIKELNSLEEMKEFQELVHQVTGNKSYSFIVDFNSPTIFFDDKC